MILARSAQQESRPPLRGVPVYLLAICALSWPSLSSAEALQRLQGLVFPVDVEVSFEQRQSNTLLRRVQKAEGTLRRSEQEGLVMLIQQPRKEERRIADGAVTLVRWRKHPRTRGMLAVTRTLQLDPEKAAHIPLLAMEAVLTGDLDFLSRHFRARELPLENSEYARPSVSPELATWRVSLEPLAVATTRVTLYGMGKHLLMFRSEQRDAVEIDKTISWLEVTIQPPTEVPESVSATFDQPAVLELK